MRVAIVRRLRGASISMDVHADGLVSGLKAVRPNWQIIELTPKSYALDKNKSSWLEGLQKYYERYWRYPATVKRQEADIFHIIDHSDAHIVYWLKGTGKSVTVTCHDLINFLQPENIHEGSRLSFISTIVWKFAVRGLHQAKHIISVSAHTAKDIVQILKIAPERITVAPNGVDSLFRPLSPTEFKAFRQQHQISPDTICLLNVGSNQPRKNVFTVLKAVQALRAQEVSVHLLKTGADFTREQKVFIQKYNLDNCITYLGKPDKASLVEIYNAADILLSPSLYEGFGITILEAMACGTAVITSNVTSLPEVAGDAAILVEPMDVDAIVKAVLCLKNDADFYQRLINQGLTRAKLFTWEKTAEQVASIYETLVAKGSSKVSEFNKPQLLPFTD
ncbi:MAG: glycosyltransferase family 1 protein [Scytonema sp. PMC 1069.18]|nr:glycosyltransferase family 1 protein [Scytonema sp. PMC 1069.18]MEC4880682.1 glycosyltransferase family 1 protein [Scytonema sp. PMC 1070.18]